MESHAADSHLTSSRLFGLFGASLDFGRASFLLDPCRHPVECPFLAVACGGEAGGRFGGADAGGDLFCLPNTVTSLQRHL